MQVVEYSPQHEEAWDRWVAACPRGTFQQQRRFLDYHGERFVDASLMVWDDRERLVAVWPAAAWPGRDTVVSHPGAVHGGLVHAETLGPADLDRILEQAIPLWRAAGFRELVYKPVPASIVPGADERDVHALWRRGAQARRMDLWNVVWLGRARPVSKNLRRDARVALRDGLVVTRASTPDELAAFHQLLQDCLAERHDATPVHRLDELEDLCARLGDQQEVVLVHEGERLLAGTWVFRYGEHAVHTQYIASSAEGRSKGAPTLMLADVLAAAEASGAQAFSFGASTTDAGMAVNDGLFQYKNRFGGSTITHTHWTLSLEPS